jgi:hypothetical protein
VPARLRKIRKACSAYGIELETPKGGSHWKFRRGKGPTYPVPSHNGLKTEVPDEYIRGLCAHFDLDRDEFKKML